MTGRIARRLLVLATVAVAGAGLGAVPALAADEEEPTKTPCTEGGPDRSLLSTLGLSAPNDSASRQACNNTSNHVDRSGQEPAEGFDPEAEDAGATEDAADADDADDADGTTKPAGGKAATDKAGTDKAATDKADTDKTATDKPAGSASGSGGTSPKQAGATSPKPSGSTTGTGTGTDTADRPGTSSGSRPAS